LGIGQQKARSTGMDPATTCCPNLACPARGHTGQGTIGIHSRKAKRCLCPACQKTFTATKGTGLYRLRTAAETGRLVVPRLAHGCPPPASVVACGDDERTGTSWVARAGGQGPAVQAQLVEPPRDLGHVQADAIRLKKPGGIVWRALARMVTTRWWRAGEVSAPRARTRMRRGIERVRAWAGPGPGCCAPMAWAPPSERCARPCVIPCVRESRDALGGAPGATEAWRRSCSARPSGGGA